MKIKHLCWIFFCVSIIINILLITIEEDSETEKLINETDSVYPVDFSSFDQNISFEPDYPVYTGFTLEGDQTEFLNFRLTGTIFNSIKKKYNKKVSRKLVRNIQEIVYFINNSEIRFSKGDKLSVIYRKKDSKIVFLRFRSVIKRSVHEVFLFTSDGQERYLTSAQEYLQPCITNGPFKNCPDASLISDGRDLVPVFNTGFNEKIRLPFLAKFIKASENYRKGGEMEFAYSNLAVKAVFKGLARININLRKNALYRKGTVIGESGFAVNNNSQGVVYYLKKNDNRIISPFSFHHTEAIPVAEKEKINIKITISFYRNQYKAGREFENNFY